MLLVREKELSGKIFGNTSNPRQNLKYECDCKSNECSNEQKCKLNVNITLTVKIKEFIKLQ